MRDQFDFSLVDQELLEELELMTQLIIVASESDALLTPEQIDSALGLSGASDEPSSEVRPHSSDRRIVTVHL